MARLLAFLFLFVTVAGALAGDVSVSASLSQASVAVGESAELTIAVSGARNAQGPERIEVEGLTINYAGQSTQMQIVNFDMKMTLSLNYIVTPQRAGTFVIPPQEVVVGREKFTTPELKLTVGASAPDSGAKERLVFAEIVLPKETAYVGEAVPAEIRVYVDSRVRWQADQMAVLKGDGFTAQKMPNPTQSQATRDGRSYDVMIFRTAITPVKTGKLSLGPGQVSILAQVPRQRRQRGNSIFDDDFFMDPFGSMGVAQRVGIEAPAIELEVKPLPAAGQPKGFSGAVGQFEMSMSASPERVKTGDPITVSVKLTGNGGFDRVNAPRLADEAGWRSYPPSAKFEQNDEVGISGTKSFEMAVIPDEPKQALPSLEFSFFDPVKEKYVTLQSEPKPIVVEGPAAAASNTAVAKNASPSPTPAPTAAPSDILHIRTDAGVSWNSFNSLHHSRQFWLIQLLPLTGLLAFTAFRFHRARRGDAGAVAQAARRREKQALQARLKDPGLPRAEFLDCAVRLIQTEAARGHQLPSGIEASEAIGSRSLDPVIAQGIRTLFEARAELRYGGSSAGAAPIAATEREAFLKTVEAFEHAS